MLTAWLTCTVNFAQPPQPAEVKSSERRDPSKRFVFPSDESQGLIYDQDAVGNRIPDFSFCGYAAGQRRWPQATVRVTVDPGPGDQTQRIQSAIDYVSQLPMGADGLRGAVQLMPGTFAVNGQLKIQSSGVVLRGSDQPHAPTLLKATGNARRALILVHGSAIQVNPQSIGICDVVACGAERFRVDSTEGLAIGQWIQISHTSSKQWIAQLGMDRFPTDERGSWLDWRPGAYDVHWNRQITKVESDWITVDAPITMTLDPMLANCHLRLVSARGRIEQVGIEHLQIDSDFDTSNGKDEQHAWDGISFDHVLDAWVDHVRFQHLAGSAVIIQPGGQRITVLSCDSINPVSEIASLRRRTFFTHGQQALFRHCTSRSGIEDFSVGYLAAGPNAFVHCRANETLGFSGPVESWATGVLYDNVEIDGGGLKLTNLETAGQGIGWAAANCVLWQCTASEIECRRPPTATNWAIACWGEFTGDGDWRSMNEFARPECLYDAQLRERLLKSQDANTIDVPKPDDVDLSAQPVHVDAIAPGRSTSTISNGLQDPVVSQPLALRNGWLTIGGKMATGTRLALPWWRGSLVPARAAESGPAVTRFVPGRNGLGYTDDLDEMTNDMLAKGQRIVEHHWGLWYDRRRDDHQMIRRANGHVWGPFYEQPWARSGQGTAWDGLSKYDLDSFNVWYFDRLVAIARLAEQKGLVLQQHMYFQHNILEAGAHWADFPWRPANCLQTTGFQEPPVYVNKKRIFNAEAFYDVQHPERRRLHEKYIRHCLDSLSISRNVIFTLGEEFTGPQNFVEFWLDTIAHWQRDTGKDPLICLSCTKDVQDAILSDAHYRELIDIIEIKYWWPTASGTLYEPQGGLNLAPRQHLREWKGDKSRSDVQLAHWIRQYRMQFPEKAVLCALAPKDGWELALAGCSLPPIANSMTDAIAEVIPALRPATFSVQGEDHPCLKDDTTCLLLLERDKVGGIDQQRNYSLRPDSPSTGYSAIDRQLLWLQRPSL